MLSIPTLFFILWGVVGCKGQSNKIFQWEFQNQAISDQLGTCFTYPIVVKPYNATGNNGVPPYYMISFAIGSTPVTTSIGTDPNNLMWTLTQPAGSSLLLSVVDSTGGAGGIPPRLFSVIAGQTTQCVSTPPPLNPAFKVTANVTGNLETCQPWGITVSGGVPPYTITLAETNQPVVTNVTMDLGANRFTFPNRANPGGSLIAAISDVGGQWADGTPVVHPIGSTDTSCTGLVSSSGNATLIDAQDASLNAQANANKRRESLVTGVVVTLVLLLLIGCGVMWYLRYRKRTQSQQRHLSEERVHHQFDINQVPQTWERFDSSVGSLEAGLSVPIYEKHRRTRVSEPEVQAPPYQEIDSDATSLGRATAGGPVSDPVVGPSRSLLPPGGDSKKSLHLPRRDIPKPRPTSTGASLSASQQGTGVSSTSAATSEMISAFPDAPVSTPGVTSATSPRTGRKTSAGFVTFPRTPVRTSGLGAPSSGPEEQGQSANGSPVDTPAPEKLTGRLRAHEVATFSGVEQLPRYRSGPQ